MELLRERTEIASAINFHKYPVISIDLSEADEYGLKSCKVLIDNGTFRDGNPYYIHSEVRAYRDERFFKFSQGATGLSGSFGYSDVKEMLEYRNAPIVKPGERVLIVVIDSKKKKVLTPMILKTRDKVDAYCSTPLTFEDEDYSTQGLLLEAGIVPDYLKDSN